MMLKNRKTKLACALAPVVILTAGCLKQYQDFLDFENYGGILLLFSLLTLIISGIATFLPWLQDEKKWKKLLTFFLFLLTPLLMECSVELLNGNMLWDIDLFGNIHDILIT